MIKQFTYIISTTNNLQSSEPTMLISNQEIKQPWLPILWNRRGLFRIIPLAKIQNIIQRNKDMGAKDERLFFNWYDAIQIDHTTVRLLLGDDVNNKCTYGGKSNAPSS